MAQPKFVGGKNLKQTEMEPVYDLKADLNTVLHQIVQDLREKKNDELRKMLGVSWKELEWCSMKFGGNTLELRVNILDGSLRQPKQHPAELQKRIKEAGKVLDKFEKAVRKEFKSRTGKALTWVKPKEHCDGELVALNGLYRFFAVKMGQVKTTLPGQSFDDE